MQYSAPDDRTVLRDPAAEQLERELRDRPYACWQGGGNGEAILDAGAGGPSLWIKQPEPGRFFLTYAHPPANWLVPYTGGPCEDLVHDERGGDPFLIPRACLVDTDQAVAAVRYFLEAHQPTPVMDWRYWHELPLPAEAVRWSGGT